MPIRAAGTLTIAADRETVWAALHDVDCLRRCVPGCYALARVAETRYALSARMGLGILALPFKGEVEACEADPPRRLVLRASGQGVTGHATGTAKLELSPSSAGCRVAYLIDAETSPALALLGRPMLQGAVNRLVERFGSRLAALLEASVSI